MSFIDGVGNFIGSVINTIGEVGETLTKGKNGVQGQNTNNDKNAAQAAESNLQEVKIGDTSWLDELPDGQRAYYSSKLEYDIYLSDIDYTNRMNEIQRTFEKYAGKENAQGMQEIFKQYDVKQDAQTMIDKLAELGVNVSKKDLQKISKQVSKLELTKDEQKVMFAKFQNVMNGFKQYSQELNQTITGLNKERANLNPDIANLMQKISDFNTNSAFQNVDGISEADFEAKLKEIQAIKNAAGNIDNQIRENISQTELRYFN